MAGRFVAGVGVCHRAQDGELVHLLGRPRQMLADLDAGTLVAIGLNSPRYSAGASGFRSHVSMWLGPPPFQIRMTEVSFAARREPPGRPAARSTSASVRPARPSKPALRKLRRLTPSQCDMRDR